jgi:apolipoprotein N-acyltransferase
VSALRGVGGAKRPAGWWWWPPLSGLLFALAFAPLNLLPFAVVGLWPLLAFLDRVAPGERFGRVFAGGFLFGLAYYGALLYWIAGLSGFSRMAIPAYVVGVLVMAPNSGLMALGTVFAYRRGAPLAVAFPLAWSGAEWLRSFGDMGFPWAMAGVTVTPWPILIQIAELGGGWLVGLWVVALASASWRLARPRGDRLRPAALTAILALAVPLYGAVRLHQLERESAQWPTFRAAAIQPNVPQGVKWDDAFEAETMRRLETMTERSLQQDPQLVVWPESAIPGYLRYDPTIRAVVTRLAARTGVPILTGTVDADTVSGATGDRPQDYRIYNAAYLVRGDGTISAERYGKRRLVPVAERVPFLPDLTAGLFEKISSWTGQFAPGEGWPTWRVDGARVGVLICYESVFPDVARALVRSGADVLLNITNDAWFGPTSAPYQHAAHLGMRAVEHRVPFLRAANTGISGWVDPMGRWHDATPLYTYAIVVADLPRPHVTTLYTRWGDWAPFAAVLAWGALCLAGPRRRRLSPG